MLCGMAETIMESRTEVWPEGSEFPALHAEAGKNEEEFRKIISAMDGTGKAAAERFLRSGRELSGRREILAFLSGMKFGMHFSEWLEDADEPVSFERAEE